MEELLKKEANLTDVPDINTAVDSNVNSVLAAYKSEGDPDLYEYSYLELRRFVDESLDIYKVIPQIPTPRYYKLLHLQL